MSLEKIMEKMLDNQSGFLEGMINGVLKDAIYKHGPITRENFSSTTKRIANNWRGLLNSSKAENVDAVVKNQIVLLEKQIVQLTKVGNNLRKRLKEKYGETNLE